MYTLKKKKNTKIAYLVLALFFLISCAMPLKISAEEPKAKYEAVLLIDVSWSMNTSDETKMTIEAARAFAYYYPSYADLYLSLVIYSSDASIVLEKVNVCTEEGMAQYQACLDRIKDGSIQEDFPNVQVWSGLTHMGKAMELAKEVLDKSTADKKATLLFTDGNVNLMYAADEAVSEQAVISVSDEFGKQSIPVYCVGLNADGTVDEDFLKSVSDKTGGETRICTTVEELDSLFAKVFSLFVSGSYFDEENVTEYETSPDVKTEHGVNIYGQATKEVNVSLVCTSEIHVFYVKSPDGASVVNVNTSTGEEKIDKTKCAINRNANGKVVNIKLTDPADGTWTIGMMSQTPGTVKVSEIYTNNLEVKCERPAEIEAGDKADFIARVYNSETGALLDNERMYNDSTLVVTATHTESGTSETFQGKYSKKDNGYSVQINLKEIGSYDITYSIENSQFVIESSDSLVTIEGAPNSGPIIIVCIIVAVVLIVLAIIAFLYIKKRMLIRINFRVKMVYADEDGNNNEIVYAVSKFAGKKNVKGKMPLSTVLNNNILSRYSHGDIDDSDERKKIISDLSDKIMLVGDPFKNEFKILTEDGKKYTFSRNQTRVPIKIDDKEYYIYFGNTTSFPNSDV